jgi:1-hydroxycarotenoid 3,4-desaturase
VFDDLFHVAGEDLADHITLIPQPLLARHWWLDGSRLDLTTDAAQNAAAIADFAGQKSADEFRAFDAQSAQLYAAFDQPMMRAGRPDLARIALNALGAPAIWPALSRRLGEHLARSFSELFGRYATYVGGAPDLSPAVLALIWRAEAQGVWAVQGGMHILARALADLAVRVGVTPHYGVSAYQIIRQNDQVREVVLSTGQSIAADAVVFNGDPAALLSGLSNPCRPLLPIRAAFRLGCGPLQPPQRPLIWSITTCFSPVTPRGNSPRLQRERCRRRPRFISVPKIEVAAPLQAPNALKSL